MLSPSANQHPLDTRRVLTASRLQAYLSCERLQFHRYVEGWQEKKTSDAITFGKLVHKGLEEFYKTKTPECLGGDTSIIYPALLDEADRLQIPVGFDRDAAVFVADELLRRYANYWADDKLVTLHTEQEFIVSLKDIECELYPDVDDWCIAGKIDAIVMHIETRCVYIVEHKTSGPSINTGNKFWDTINYRTQLSMYMLAARSLKIDIDGVILDAIKNPSKKRKEATPPDKVRLKKDGTPYASTRISDETLSQYKERVIEELESVSEVNFNRAITSRDNEQLDNFAKEYISRTCRDIEINTTKESNRMYERSCNPYSNTCPFLSMCSGTCANSVDTLVKGDIFPELEIVKNGGTHG